MFRSRSKSFAAAAAALIAAVAPAAFTAPPAHAEGSSSPVAADYLTAQEAADFSKQIERRLADEGVRVAIVFRTGRARDRMPDGVAYTHGGFWVYRDIVTEDGEHVRGYAVYNLYHGDGESLPRTRSYLAQDWPIDFTRPSVVDDVGVIVPTPEMQRRILAIIDSPRYEALHNPRYSLIANPQEPIYQNCTGFMLDVVAAAAWETDDAAQIAANLKAYFEPQKLEVGALQRFFAPIVDERLKTDDQHGGLRTATYHSMAAFMESFGLAKASYVIIREGAAI
jgi:hypothetical protein